MADLRLCSISDCGKPALTAGYCNAHYLRFWRHGDPLAGRTRNGNPRLFIDTVVRTYEGEDCLIWPYSKNSNGYGQINVGGKPEIVSRIVCEMVNGPPTGEARYAAHSCGKGDLGCVSPLHLSWKTPKGNAEDMVAHGTSPRGAKSASAKLSAENVTQIRSLFGLMSQRAISNSFGVSEQTICDIKKGRIWSHHKPTLPESTASAN
jgi:hypothetical protein